MNGYRKFASGLYQVNKAVSKVELALMTIIMIVLTAVMTYQVVTRYFLEIPATWAEELCRYLFIWASFIGGAYGVFIWDHIEIDLIDNVIKKHSKNPQLFLAWFKKLILVVILLFACYFFHVYLNYVLQIASLGQYSGAMEINMVYPMASGVVGIGLIVFHGISLLLMPVDMDTEEKKDGGEAQSGEEVA